MDAEDVAVVAAGRVGDEVCDAFAAVGGEFLEERFCLGFCEGPHFVLVWFGGKVLESCLLDWRRVAGRIAKFPCSFQSSVIIFLAWCI